MNKEDQNSAKGVQPCTAKVHFHEDKVAQYFSSTKGGVFSYIFSSAVVSSLTAGSVAHQSCSPPAHETVIKHSKKEKKSLFLPLRDQFGARDGVVRADPCAWERSTCLSGRNEA